MYGDVDAKLGRACVSQLGNQSLNLTDEEEKMEVVVVRFYIDIGQRRMQKAPLSCLRHD